MAALVSIPALSACSSATAGMATIAGSSTPTDSLTSTANWPSYLYGPTHNSFNVHATSISPKGVSDLRPVWRWTPPNVGNGGGELILSSPTVVNGVVYIGVNDGYFYAVRESDQKILWSRFLGIERPTTCAGTYGVTSTATVAANPTNGQLTVYVNGPDGYLYALDAASGAVDWRSVVGIPSATKNNYYAWSSALVVRGYVYIGVSSNCDSPLVLGGLRSYRQATGAPVAFWHATRGGLVGGSIWSSPALLSDGSIVAVTGNGIGSEPQPLYNESIVRLRAGTLKLLDHWELPLSERIDDSDFGGSPADFTAKIGGLSTPMVGSCNKNGVYYAFRQNDFHNGPVWQFRMTSPYVKNGYGQCDAAAIWDGSHLIEGGGASTKIDHVLYQGSVRSLNPANGHVIWATGIPGDVIGSPTEDGAGVVAADVFHSTTGGRGVYLLDASTGRILGVISTDPAEVFSQPVFAGPYLFVAGALDIGLTAYAITKPGPPVKTVMPNAIGGGASETVQVTGSGFSGTPKVFVSGAGVVISKAAVTSSTTIAVKLSVLATADTPGWRDVTVDEAEGVADSCSHCLRIDAPPTPTTARPDTLPTGSANQSVTLSGLAFQRGATTTSAHGISIVTTFVSPTKLDLSVTIATSVAAGSYNLAVSDPDGGIGICKGCLNVTS